MTIEDYVSFETAELLKEKGFNCECTHCFALDTNEIQNIYDDVIPGYALLHPQDWNHITEEELCQIGLSGWTNLSAPTLWAAMKWLREVHNLHISISVGLDSDTEQHYFFAPFVHRFKKSGVDYITPFSDDFDTAEEAAEAGIKYCLENLI